ncbi:CHAT domain-containing protein [Microseira sp. BLCC-F43]|uniref:CHAT domain-containing protein n=1 Tax=Microseira sp. BLCC-F43 TaxID=3153602 RepID=UPI0035B86C35
MLLLTMFLGTGILPPTRAYLAAENTIRYLVSRNSKAGETPTLQDITLQDITLQDITLQGITLQDITLQGITLQGITLQDITLQGITPQDITLQDITLQGITLQDITPQDITPQDITPQEFLEKSIVQSLPDGERLVEQGRNLYEQERFNEAVLLLQRAIEVFAGTGDELRQAIALSNLSLAYQQLGQWEKAEDAIAQSLNLLETGRNLGISNEQKQVFAQALDVKGRLQLSRGKAQDALITWQRSGELYAQISSPIGVMKSRINSAQALQALGLYRQARNTLTESIKLLENQPNSLLKATALRSLGNVLRVVGDLEASRQILQQSLTVAQAIQSSQAEADILISLGNTARASGDIEAALEFYKLAVATSTLPSIQVQAKLHQLSLLLEDKQLDAALSLSEQIQSQIANLPETRTGIYAQIQLAESLIKLGKARGKIVNYQDIAQLLAASVRRAKNLGDRRVESYALGILGGVYEETQQLSDALLMTEQALFLAQTIAAPDIAYRWQWQLGILLKKQGNISGAIASYTSAVQTLQSLRYDLVAIDPNVQFEFRDRVEPVYRQLVDLLLRTEGNVEPIQDNLKLARDAIEALQLAELENFFRAACLDAKPEQIDRIVEQDNPTTAAIYPIILSDRLEIILKLPKGEKLHRYVTYQSQNEVETTLAELEQYLREPDRTDDVKKLSRKVYGWLIQSLEKELEESGIKTLVFVLDGELRNIPMAVLDDGEKYLVEKYAIALAPGLQLIEPKPLQPNRLNALMAGVSEKRQIEGREFAKLENVSLELQQIQSEIPKNHALFNQTFTKTNLENKIKERTYSIVHMATHGKFSSKIEETYILTWNQLLKVRDLDNLLRINESKKSSPIELLVLSACETATGDKRAALGLAGIAVRAGARSTLATLWSIDDESTAELMSEFYRQLVNTKVTKAEALQLAQKALWNHKSQDWKRPYFWASYVLIGNWL